MAFVNGFVNCAFGKDKYMCTNNVISADNWISKNKDSGQMAAVASAGMIMLWDEDAVNNVDRYFNSDQNFVRAGGYLAIGIACSGLRSEADVGYAMLKEPATGTNKKSIAERIAATLGLGFAYAGQSHEQTYELLGTLVSTEEPRELSSVAALSLGLIYVGTCNDDISNLILADLMEREGDTLNDPLYLLNALGLGLLFLQKSEEVETTLEAAEAFEEINPKYAKTLKTSIEVLAYAGIYLMFFVYFFCDNMT